MLERVPEALISQIFKLDLDAKLIADGKVVFPVAIKGELRDGGYRILIKSAQKDIYNYRHFVIELKGKVDIEYLKYRGEVKITSDLHSLNAYRMEVLEFYKENMRQFKRVPYRRNITITEPFVEEAVLVNISGSGAMLECKRHIDEEQFSMHFVLLQREIFLKAQIVEQIFDMQKKVFVIRCYFVSIDKKVQNIIIRAVKEITLRAKNRLKAN